jgi:hypothetical protein
MQDLSADKPTATGEPDPERAEVATKTAERTADEIKEAMHRRIESIQRRADALKSEANLRGLTVADQPAPEWVTSHPEKIAIAAAGVGAGLAILTGLPGKARRRRLKRRREADQSAVLRYYMNAVVEDAARRQVAGGPDASAEGAMHESLRASGPVIFAPGDPEEASRGPIRQAFSLAFKTALGFAVKAVLDELTQKLTGEDELFEALGHADDGTLTPPEDGAMAFSSPVPPPQPPPVAPPPVAPPGVEPVPSPS